MTKKRTYRVFENEEHDGRELLYEEVRNEAGKVLSYINYESPETTEGYYDYNGKGQLISEKEVVDGVEASKVAYDYDDSGNLIHTRQYVAEEIFEEVIHEYHESGVVVRKIRFGEEIERQAETKQGTFSVKEVFENEELTERQRAEYNPETRTYLIHIEDTDGNPTSVRSRTEDEFGNLLVKEEKNLQGQVLSHDEFQYENGKVIHEKHENFLQGHHYEIKNEYDTEGHLIHTETRALSGHLIEFEKMDYDDQGRVIAVSGVSRMGQNYMLVHEYED